LEGSGNDLVSSLNFLRGTEENDDLIIASVSDEFGAEGEAEIFLKKNSFPWSCLCVLCADLDFERVLLS
jgi:hypothetical protein